ncbi:SDR family oxidoreductase [Kitasatospora sp. NPDC059571]|uniref:SDR family oxidoreductase n=1 Tax=Kitasatospora sp. NPDC059571 TaxID=3346871 RepID=UPI0036CD15A3
MSSSFADQRIAVLGASHGIGEAAAAAFAASGADVIIAGRSKERLDAAAERIGRPVTAVETDATDPESVAAFLAVAGQLDHLVIALSSGAVGLGPFAQLAEADLRAAFDGKLFAHLAILRAALPHLRADGSVTFVTAASARAALPGSVGLAAVNGALESAVPPLAAELAPLRVNAVSPGVVDTAWWSGIPEPDRAAFFAGIAATLPVGRIGTPEDVAQAITYLAGNGFTTGTVLDCAGGATLATGR